MGYYLDFYGPAIYDFFFTHGQQSARALVESVGEYLKPGMKVLDVGTGTGLVAFEVASLIGEGSTDRHRVTDRKARDHSGTLQLQARDIRIE